ncbi:fibulin-2-like isoform X2 [Lampris incognitus]|uniref:fibulin-2-like isoform X2 n=1 Tax=Lampris incognitus TaxID=2546036 RepID=UPI0024B5D6E1|nr:fibulin-2-like isoform X2 [Lampris incognitus]
MNNQKLTSFLCWVILCVDTSSSQKDCTGVDCPILQNCIEEVLQKGACCATCVRKGCTCEGYQYYDCIHAGFQKGKVPEGESYFVDFGSTECSCPQGGGKISCRFIPCPDIPPNCIDVLQPEDGCPQCGRIGCVLGNKKYEAGHSFQMDPCQVCHCPNDGGGLMCSPIPGCDPHSIKPMLVTTTENNNPLKDISRLHDSSQINPREPFSKLAQQQQVGNTLPLYKPDPPSFGTEDYDYTLAGPTSSTPRDVAQPLESTTVPPAFPESGFISSNSHDDRRREKQRNSDQERRDKVEDQHYDDHTPTRAETETPTSQTTTTEKVIAENHRPKPEVSERTVRQQSDRDREVQDTLKDTMHSSHTDKGVKYTGHHKHSQNGHTGGHGGSNSQGHKAQETAPVEHLQPLSKERQGSYPTVQFSPTSQAPIRVREEGDQPKKQPQTLHNYQPQNREEDTDVSVKELARVCCKAGEKWATSNGHCNNMELPREDRHSICRTAQKQCCLGFLGERRCLAGINAANEGAVCEEDANTKCGADTYKECCDCCTLGLRFRNEGHQCEAHQHLSYHCRHVFLTCCNGKDGQEEQRGDGGGWNVVKERPSLDSTPPPKKVSDSPFPNEAFSISEEQDRENAAEGPFEVEDVDECHVYEDLCHHRCINTPGSFRCECFPGFMLQEDGITCERETVDEENRLKEDDRAAAGPTAFPPPPVPLNPCEGNSPCMQQCTPVGGRPQCSCFPGFSLQADGRSCEDINECLSTRACLVNERCVNTAGSFVCQRQIVCPLGYQITNDICEDINECMQATHNCGPGFVCVNTEGSFTCNPKPQCSVGFSLDTNGNCIDVDECSSVAHPCSPGFNCVNTMGSYTCQRKIIMCSRGYHASPDGSRCIDVDECQSNAHRCGEGQLCHNMPGSYRCDCQTGYQYDTFRRTCVDVNECLTNPCSQECANVYGSYQCYCRQGYYLREDGHTCEDIDECSQNIGHLCTYKCVNVPGSYKCACPEHGYSMSPNGRSCRDVDECATAAHNCSIAETCYNIQGGYRCLSFSCPQSYRKVSDTRCERISCPNYLDCQNTPLRITYYYLSFQSNIVIPAQIFRIGPSPAYSGDNVIVSITKGNEENYFSTRKLNAYTGAVYLHRQVRETRDFLIDVEMKLWRQGAFTTFLAKIYVFITTNSL